jgi:hypothetical protein
MIPGSSMATVPTSPLSEAAVRRIVREEIIALLVSLSDAAGRESAGEYDMVTATALNQIEKVVDAVKDRMECPHPYSYPGLGGTHRCGRCEEPVPGPATE